MLATKTSMYHATKTTYHTTITIAPSTTSFVDITTKASTTLKIVKFITSVRQ